MQGMNVDQSEAKNHILQRNEVMTRGILSTSRLLT